MTSMKSVLIVFLLFVGISAQEQAHDSPRSFEVVTVKANKSGDDRSQMADPPGRSTATNVPLEELIEFAWQVQSFQVDGGPGWIKSDRFDIVAKTGSLEAPTPGQPTALQMMLRSLLADRFGVIVHSEEKERPIFALTFVAPDRRLGPGFRPDSANCETLRKTRAPGGATCGWRNTQGRLSIVGQPIAIFVQLLSVLLRRTVVDRTGLAGSYDVDLTYTLDQAIQQPPADTNAPSLFTAVQEQLGLKLESTTGRVPVLVIDQAKKPTPD